MDKKAEVYKSALLGGLIGTAVGLITQMEKATTGGKRIMMVAGCTAYFAFLHGYGTGVLMKDYGDGGWERVTLDARGDSN